VGESDPDIVGSDEFVVVVLFHAFESVPFVFVLLEVPRGESVNDCDGSAVKMRKTDSGVELIIAPMAGDVVGTGVEVEDVVVVVEEAAGTGMADVGSAGAHDAGPSGSLGIAPKDGTG
jgi:hypothetical protein